MKNNTVIIANGRRYIWPVFVCEESDDAVAKVIVAMVCNPKNGVRFVFSSQAVCKEAILTHELETSPK